jgi:hypothetical protein
MARSHPGENTGIRPRRGYRDPAQDRIQVSCPLKVNGIPSRRGYRDFVKWRREGSITYTSPAVTGSDWRGDWISYKVQKKLSTITSREIIPVNILK